MEVYELIKEIKADLGSDVNSLGIDDRTIRMKVEEALRKISAFAPYQVSESFDVVNGGVNMPKNTVAVVRVLNIDNVTDGGTTVYSNDQDLFSYSRYMYNYNDISDPYIFLMQRNALNTLQTFVSIKDWRYDAYQGRLYLNNFSGTKVSVLYLRKYEDLNEVKDQELLQTVKEYALALCKIIEGTIRRKLQSAPGAIQMDGDALVSEGTSEKNRLDELIPRQWSHLRFGIRC